MPSCSEDSDCELSDWGMWSECSCSCNGIRERNRHISAYSRGQGAVRNEAILEGSGMSVFLDPPKNVCWRFFGVYRPSTGTLAWCWCLSTLRFTSFQALRTPGRPCADLPLKVIEPCNPTEGAEAPAGCNERPQDCARANRMCLVRLAKGFCLTTDKKVRPALAKTTHAVVHLKGH